MEIRLSTIVTIVSGGESLRGCLAALSAQAGPRDELIVPYDSRSIEAGEMAGEFPEVRFLDDEEGPVSEQSREHDLYDRRRARGLAAARGKIIAMTEDHAEPASDWMERIIEAHEQPYAVIGGAIDNLVDRPLNQAIYYCDFGRYGTPIEGGPADYVSDVNISYKRDALMAVRDLWRNGYHETTVNWALRSRGETLYLDPRLVVFQKRPRIGFSRAYRERIEWGRVFAETRAEGSRRSMRTAYAAGTPLLPFLMTLRICKHMRRQRRPAGEMLTTALIAIVLLTGWALGELTGYLAGEPADRQTGSHPELGPEGAIEVNHR